MLGPLERILTDFAQFAKPKLEPGYRTVDPVVAGSSPVVLAEIIVAGFHVVRLGASGESRR